MVVIHNQHPDSNRLCLDFVWVCTHQVSRNSVTVSDVHSSRTDQSVLNCTVCRGIVSIARLSCKSILGWNTIREKLSQWIWFVLHPLVKNSALNCIKMCTCSELPILKVNRGFPGVKMSICLIYTGQIYSTTWLYNILIFF